MDEVHSTECPHCGETLDIPEGISNGQRLLCPCCGAKFEFQETANIAAQKVTVVGSTKASRRRRLGVWFRTHKRNMVVAIAFALVTYLCVVMTIAVCKIQTIDASVKSLRGNIRNLSSDVDSIESDLSHIKIWGVQISQ